MVRSAGELVGGDLAERFQAMPPRGIQVRQLLALVVADIAVAVEQMEVEEGHLSRDIGSPAIGAITCINSLGDPFAFDDGLMHVNARASLLGQSLVGHVWSSTSVGTRTMSRDDEIDVHTERALDEIDRATSAVSMAAAQAHLGLSELHFDKARELSEAPETRPALRLVDSTQP